MATNQTPETVEHQEPDRADIVEAEDDSQAMLEEAQEADLEDAEEHQFEPWEPQIDNVGQRLLSHLIDELTAAGAWARSGETDRKLIVSRCTRRIKAELRTGYAEILGMGVAAVQAELKKVTLEGDKIQGLLVIDRHTKQLHALADFAGSDVLVILANDVEEHLADMDDMIPIDGQQEMELDPGLHESVVDAGIAAIQEAAEEVPAGSQQDEEAAEILFPDVDPSRVLFEDGKAIGLAPDPDCTVCTGEGGWDINVPGIHDEVTQEWVKCDCVALPA